MAMVQIERDCVWEEAVTQSGCKGASCTSSQMAGEGEESVRCVERVLHTAGGY